MEIIAEIGQNHNGDMALAIELIDAMKEAGADVAKFQLFDARALIPQDDPGFLYNCQTELSLDNLNLLNEHCETVGIEFMCSPFDVIRVGLKTLMLSDIKLLQDPYDAELIEAVA